MLDQVSRKRKIPSVSADTTLLICYPATVQKFLNCSSEQLKVYERAGKLTPNRFWHDVQIALANDPEAEKRRQDARPSFYLLDEVLSLMRKSETADQLSELRLRYRYLKAGIVQAGFRPHLTVAMLRTNRIKFQKF